MLNTSLIICLLLVGCSSVPKDHNIDQCFANVKQTCGTERLPLDTNRPTSDQRLVANCRMVELSACVKKYAKR